MEKSMIAYWRECSKEYGEEGLGCLYCYVDAAKAMTADPSRKVVHKTCAACGDEFCTFEQMLTTEAERKDFEKSDQNWGKVDPRIAKEIGLKTHSSGKKEMSGNTSV